MQTYPLSEPLYFQFYDVGVRLASDCPAYFDLFAQIFARFQIEAESQSAAYSVNATLLTGHDDPAQRPTLWLNNEEWPLHDPIALRDHLFEFVFAAIAAHIRSHILIHAAVVERNGCAFIIAGDSQHGKTSLALGLLRRGFRLLSDELAAVARTDGAVHPFPRKVRATPNSLERAGYDVAPDLFPLWLGKYLIDVERLQIASTGHPIPIGDIIILSDRAQQGTLQQDFIRLTVERLNDAWLAALGRVEGVAALHVETSENYPVILLQTHNKVAVLTAIEALCKAHRVLCLDVQKRGPHRPDFSHAPQLTPLPKSIAVMELLSHFQGAHSSVILQEEHLGSATSFFMELADLVHNARCHRLAVGHYDQTLDLICDLTR